jgi:ribosomal-protein-alanine N-acetyltransferase
MITLRTLKSSDIETILALRRNFFGDFLEKKFKNYIQKNPGSIVIAHEEKVNDRILGYAFAYPWRSKEGVIHHMLATSDYQEEIEKILLQNLLGRFAENDLLNIRCWVKDNQTHLIKLLNNHSFEMETELLAFRKDNLRPLDIEEPGNENIQILDFTERFIDDVLNIETQCFKASWHQTRGDFLRFRNRKNTWFCIAHVKDECAGYMQISASDDLGYIGRVAVLPKFQGDGLGSVFISESMKWFSQNGARKVKLRSPVANVPAHNLYKKFGFKQIGREYDYFKKGKKAGRGISF